MLMIMGSIYSETKENFDELCGILEKEGYEIAHSALSSMSASILKEVETPDESNNQES